MLNASSKSSLASAKYSLAMLEDVLVTDTKFSIKKSIGL